MAWGKINPKLKCLAEEDYNKREFGPGFLELASSIWKLTRLCQWSQPLYLRQPKG
jgi:hypothetical protein